MKSDNLKKMVNRIKKIEWDQDTLSNYYGKFTAGPFTKGVATTLGNTLRRMLLSSIKGAAVTSIKIDGILHEFTTIPGVTEDISEIILNIKKLIIKMDNSESQKIYIKKKGPGEVQSSDIICDKGNIEIVKQDLHIATLNNDADLNMELEVDTGYGYVSAARNKRADQPIGVIPIDSIFTPVVRVSYSVEEMRVEHKTDYEKLILEMHTNGSVIPEDALTYAARNLREHLSLFINKEEILEEEEEIDEEKEKLKTTMAISVEELELSVRSANCLRSANITTLGELAKKTEQEMLKTRNFGKKSLNEIREKLITYGLNLGLRNISE
ncbi:MAG: DNA-directed RNA polymerase subunit alpha [bacterium]|nr:DNA-directed RNA polymerase subunit alpha [bacterium]